MGRYFGSRGLGWGFCLLSGLAFFTLVFASMGERGVGKIWHLSKQVRMLEGENQKLAQDIQDLRWQVYYLRHAPLAVENLARRELNMLRPGELVFRLPLARRPHLCLNRAWNVYFLGSFWEKHNRQPIGFLEEKFPSQLAFSCLL